MHTKSVPMITTVKRSLSSSFTNIIKPLSNQYKLYGVRGMFSGMTPVIIMCSCHSAIMFFVYESSIKFFNKCDWI